MSIKAIHATHADQTAALSPFAAVTLPFERIEAVSPGVMRVVGCLELAASPRCGLWCRVPLSCDCCIRRSTSGVSDALPVPRTCTWRSSPWSHSASQRPAPELSSGAPSS